MERTFVVCFAVSLALVTAPIQAQAGEECCAPPGDAGSDGHDSPEGGDDAWQETDYGIDVDCRAQNDFGYIATASGRLRITSRSAGRFALSGTLSVNAKFYDAPDHIQSLVVQGSADGSGAYLNADVIAGATDLQSMLLSFTGMSQISSPDGIQYQTECSHSDRDWPVIADLAPLRTLRFSALPDGQQRAQIDVSNTGTSALIGPDARVRVAGLDRTGTLYANLSGANALEPGEQGYIQVDLPANTLARCGEYALILDLDHTLQSGPFDPFADDSAQVASPCLRWNTIITDDALGLPADPLIKYQTLESIVNGQTIARADGRRCSDCHFAGSGRPYSPGSEPISPTLLIGTYSWSSIPGWADVFQSKAIKPDYLKQAFRRWQDDGAL